MIRLAHPHRSYLKGALDAAVLVVLLEVFVAAVIFCGGGNG